MVDIAEQAGWSQGDHIIGAGDRFRMGSNTKTMVAAVVVQLVGEHKLTLTDPVDTWLPGLIPDGKQITLRMLLNHTSGLFNYLADPAVLKATTGQDGRMWTPGEVLAAAVTHPPLSAPGAQYSYSNTNYLLLGLAAEKVTGENLADLVQQRISAPLRLRDTYLIAGADRPITTTLAHGYEPDATRLATLLPPNYPAGTAFVGPSRPGGYVDTTNINLSAEWAAGGMVSTAEDWARFLTALLSGHLLMLTELKEMQTTVSEGPSTPNRYGLGLEQVVTPCGNVWGTCRTGSWILQRGLHRQHRPAHHVGFYLYCVRPCRPRDWHDQPGRGQCGGLRHAEQTDPGHRDRSWLRTSRSRLSARYES